MTDEQRDLFDEERLDGHTVEELSDYLDAGRLPADPTIDDSAGCQIALAALERLRATSLSALDAAESATPHDESWIRSVMADIAMDAHAGRDIPIPYPDPAVRLAITEGAVRELVRSVGDAQEGLLVGRVRLVGDVETLGAPVGLQITVTVRYGYEIPVVVAALRGAVRAALLHHVVLDVDDIEVTVTDIHGLPEELR
ncbi:hypothetical protein ACFJGV_01425 [Cnuibacter sp. UC19_7]|uniref:hypothetical protein n=1 Tax=Cnuibacter sp. UC19_7 TaxID=3350166 RepID=UPI00366FC280